MEEKVIYPNSARMSDEEWRVSIKRLFKGGRYKEAMESLRQRWRQGQQKERLSSPSDSERAKGKGFFGPGFMFFILAILVGLLFLTLALP